MDISLTGNPKTMMAEAGAMVALPAAEGAPARETPAQATPNLIVTETPAPTEAGGIPPAELEKAIVRDDGLGKLVDKALAKVVPKDVTAKVAEMFMKSQFETAKSTIDNLKPSEREIEMRKEHAKRLRELQDELKQNRKNYEEAKAQFESMFATGDPEFKALLDKVSINA